MRRALVKLLEWNDIEGEFSNTLVLGNGASIAVHQEFAYKSLLERARREGLVDDNVEVVFKYLETEDFELVLNMLWHTRLINNALGTIEAKSDSAYRGIKSALIGSVRSVHPNQYEKNQSLDRIYPFMQKFKTIFSLNYDLLVYWSMLEGNTQLAGNWFKDCFISGSFDADISRYRTPLDGAEKVTLIFYPHGNLILAANLAGEETKITRNNESERILDRIVTIWEAEDVIPLFVSEGSSTQKLRSIRRSRYLSTVYDSIMTEEVGDYVATIGWSLSDNDDHILRQLLRGEVKRVAVSVYTAGKSRQTINDYCTEVRMKVRKHGGRKVEISFFDVQSHGCWLS